MKNNSLEGIAEELKKAERILIFPHITMDGDTLGSSVALCRGLRSMGKSVQLLMEEPVPDYLQFLGGVFEQDEVDVSEPDLCVAVDCSDLSRIGMRRDVFFSSKISICVDHHMTNDRFAQMNYVDSKAAATGEIVFRLLKKLGVAFTPSIAEPLYTAIVADTGNFQYTNTTKETHLIAAELFDVGFDLEKVSVELYQNVRPEKILLSNLAMNTMEIFCRGKADIAYVTQEMLTESSATINETEGIIETLRNIKGVEISAFLKEQEREQIKVSFRAKTYGDVAKIAVKFGGGGHKKAAGCTIYAPMAEAITKIRQAITEEFETKRMEE